VGDCVFCEIVAGRSPVSTFYEDEMVLGFMTLGPVTEGHAMVMPKRHVPYLADLDEATGRHLWTVTHRAAAALRASGLRCEGVSPHISSVFSSSLWRDGLSVGIEGFV